ncbi:hypothetical protein GOBAR_DD12301 [Gossypium barbadense]|nr:hypothetical protein GOBAR_DD12301 [Gossypium barbadense]
MASNSGRGYPTNGSIYVCNLPEGTDESMLAEYFGTIGLLKKDKRTGRPKVWLYRDKVTNEPKGDATVTYEDPHAALAAVEWFNGKDFHGSTIGVFMAESKSSNAGVDVPTAAADGGGFEDDAAKDIDGGGGRGRGRFDSSAEDVATGGRLALSEYKLFQCQFFISWCVQSMRNCSTCRCGNINWAKHMKCNICNTNKPGHNEGGVRGGRAGGYKELDEEEIEETRRRRREAEDDDGEMHDEFGNLKKNKSGYLAGVIDRNGRERSIDRESSKNREREDRERRRSRSRERDRGKDRRRDYNYERDRDRDRDRSRYFD